MLVFSIASRYLIPKRGQLSVSLIALMSLGVISLVTWLLLVFLSVTEGIEEGWVKRLTALNAPLRITPTPAYFDSYYYNADALSFASNYTLKTIAEKAAATAADPFDPGQDGALPKRFPKQDLDPTGKLIDPVKSAYAILENEGLKFQDFLVSGALLRLQMVRGAEEGSGGSQQSFLTQVSYLATFSDKSPTLNELLVEPRQEDLRHLLYLSQFSHEKSSSDTPNLTLPATPSERKARSSELLKHIAIGKELTVRDAKNAPWVHATGEPDRPHALPEDFEGASGIVLPKGFQEHGALIGDRGYFSYPAATATSVQELRLPVYVAGFYDPGIMNVGNRCILVPNSVAESINGCNKGYSFDKMLTNGLHVWFPDLKKSEQIKELLGKKFEAAGIARYWKIESYRDYDFAKPLFDQFQSDKTLFALVGTIILLVASCNIISLLVLLVNDKKREIGILLVLGASRLKIGMIFGLCGLVLGVISCALGTIAAYLTLHNIDAIVKIIGRLQGRAAFNPDFFGNQLPSQLSESALLFIFIAAPSIALLAGIVPAFKASRLRPSEILRSQ